MRMRGFQGTHVFSGDRHDTCDVVSENSLLTNHPGQLEGRSFNPSYSLLLRKSVTSVMKRW